MFPAFRPALAFLLLVLCVNLCLPAAIATASPAPQTTTLPFDVLFEHVFDLGARGGQTFLHDAEGFLWFGSEGGGLFRWDGYTLKNYPARPGALSNGTVFRIVEDALHPEILWLGTAGGLNSFDKTTETFTVYHHDGNDPQTLSDDTVQDLIQDRTSPHILWLATTNGLTRFDTHGETAVRYMPDPANPDALGYPDLWRIVQDQADPAILWIGTYGGGLERFDTRTGVFSRYLHDPDNPTSLPDPDNLIDALVHDRDDPNVLWIGSSSVGLARFDETTWTFTHYEQTTALGEVGLIYDDGRGHLWLGGYVTNNGLTVFEKTTGALTTYRNDPNDSTSLSNDLVVNVAEDREGRFWIVTYAGTVEKIDPFSQNFQWYQHQPSQSQSLSDNAVTALLEARDGAIWVGTQAGLNRWEPSRETFIHYLHDPENPDSLDVDFIQSISQGADGDLWLGTWAGPLIRFDPSTGKGRARFAAETDGFADIVVDPEEPEILWIGALVAGLARFDTQTESFTFFPQNSENPELGPSTGYLHRVLHDRYQHVIWAGGWYGGGLNRFDPATGLFTHYMADPGDPGSLSANAIAALYQDGNGSLWIGTQGGGLNRLDPTSEVFTRFGEAAGVPADVNIILEDPIGHALWLGTNEGLAQFDLISERVVRRYTRSDGLQGNVFLAASGLRTRSGELLLGGVNGFNLFRPEALRINPYPPQVTLTALTQGGAVVDWGGGKLPPYLSEITLDWQRNFFEFEAVALNYTRPEKNQYAYMLEGVDADWRYVGARRYGNYTTLPPGDYILRIKAANNDGVWNEEGIALRVTVTPPFWLRWWFIAGSAILVLGSLGGIVWGRIQSIRSQQRRLEALVEMRTCELQEANTHLQAYNVELEARNTELDAFAHTVAHDLKNPLSLIIGYGAVLEAGFETLPRDKIQDTLDRILLASKKMNYIIEELLLFASMRESRDVKFARTDMATVVGEALERLQMEIAVTGAEIALPDTWPIVMAHAPWVEEVWVNYLSNAMKYGGRPPRIMVGWEIETAEGDATSLVVPAVGVTPASNVRFWVCDNGAGLTPEELERLFTVFTRLDKVRAKGHGLGLSIVRRIVNKLGGEVGVKSVPGEGSCFWFTLRQSNEP